MGGIRNYEEVFFTPEYLDKYADDTVLINKLKDLIAEQVPLLDLCVQIHKQKAPENLQPLQKRFEECFTIMKLDIETKYGKKVHHSHNLIMSDFVLQFGHQMLLVLFFRTVI